MNDLDIIIQVTDIYVNRLKMLLWIELVITREISKVKRCFFSAFSILNKKYQKYDSYKVEYLVPVFISNTNNSSTKSI